jgi:hypothetical protein
MLEDVQKHMIIAKRYRDAGIVYERIQQQFEVESEIIEDRALKTRDAKRRALLLLHEQRIDCTVSKFETERIEIVDKNEKNMAALELARENLERRLGTAEFEVVEGSGSTQITSESDWSPSQTASHPSPAERKLTQRRLWSASFRAAPGESNVSQLAEPRWKVLCESGTKTEVKPRESKTFITSAIPSRASAAGKSVSLESRLDASPPPAVRSSRQSVVAQSEAKKSSTPSESRKSSTSGLKGSSMTYTQMLDARRSQGGQTKKLGLAELLSEQAEIDRFAAGLPPSRKPVSGIV